MSCDDAAIAEWIYFIHARRDDFAATMTEDKRAVWRIHFERFTRLRLRPYRFSLMRGPDDQPDRP